jgi:hypothetical protein
MTSQQGRKMVKTSMTRMEAQILPELDGSSKTDEEMRTIEEESSTC